MRTNSSDERDKNLVLIEDKLHDIVNWLHLGIILPLEAIEEWFKQGNYDKIAEALPSLIVQSHNILNDVRNIQTNINKNKFYKIEDFSIALKELANFWIMRAGLRGDDSIVIECPTDFRSSESIMESLIAIADEAIANATKYSGITIHPETRIYVSVKLIGDDVILEVKDNGDGAQEIIEGFGIKKIRKILSELNQAGIVTNIEVMTSVGNGFTIKIIVKRPSKPK